MGWCISVYQSCAPSPSHSRPLCCACYVYTSVFDQYNSHAIRLCQKYWKWCSVCSLVFHLIRLCVFKKRQTWHHRNPTCLWLARCHYGFTAFCQRLCAHTHTHTAGTVCIWLALLSHLVHWHFHRGNCASLLKLLGFTSPVISTSLALHFLIIFLNFLNSLHVFTLHWFLSLRKSKSKENTSIRCLEEESWNWRDFFQYCSIP